MAFDPTGQVGLPQDLEYSDILPSTQSGMPKGCDVIVAYNPAAPTYLGVGYMRGFYHPTRWGGRFITPKTRPRAAGAPRITVRTVILIMLLKSAFVASGK